MKIPDKIGTLFALRDWVLKNKPDVIEVSEKSKLMEIEEFKSHRWIQYRDIPIKYLEELK